MKLRLVSPLLAAVLALGLFAPAASAFDPNANGNVLVTLVQPDGRVLIGGSFTTVQPTGLPAPVDRPRLARFNADGSLDASFNVALDGDVTSLALQSDGRILVGGNFTEIQSGASGPIYARSGILRLESTGALDLGFDPRATGAPASSMQVSAIAIDASGRILIGGAFSALQPNGGTTVSRSRLARLNADGSVDGAFSPVLNNVVFAVAVQSDGRILVGGGFTTVLPTGGAGAVTANRLVRLLGDGSIDDSFHPSLGNRVLGLALDTSGGIVVCGDFQVAHGTPDTDDVTRIGIARFLADGSLDADFSPRTNTGVVCVALQRDGKILIGGNFTSVATTAAGTVTRPYIARLTGTGAVDTTFAVSLNASVRTLAVQDDNKVIIGGYFTRLTQAGAASSIPRSHVARVFANGDVDGSFGDESGTVTAAAREADGGLIIGGNFTTISGATRLGLARLKADASLDPDFSPAVEGTVDAILVQTDGKIVIGGSFTKVAGTERKNLARLNRDGTLDTGFNPAPSSAVLSLALESDGKILVGGSFTTFDLDDGQGDDDDNDGLSNDDSTRNYFAELTSSGQLTSLDLNINGSVYAIQQLSDGRLLLGGAFSSVKGETRNNLVRLSAAGAVDPAFKPNPSGTVQSIAVQSDGKIVIGGAFTVMQFTTDSSDDDVTRHRIARLNTDGTIDASFDPGLNSTVTGVVAASDNSVLVGGNFTQVETPATAWNYLARIRSTGAFDSDFKVQTNDRVAGLIAGANGTTYVFGRFTAASTTGGDSLTAPGHVFRLTATGTLDHTYGISTTNTSGDTVLALASESNGRVLVGGQFSYLAGRNTPNLARIYSSGTPDTTFTATADGTVRAILAAPQTIGSMAQINLFAWFNASGLLQSTFARSDMANLNGSINAIIADGDAIIVGGTFTVVGSTIKNLARFSRTGVLDANFNPAPDGSVNALARQTDGKIVVGGAFTTIAGVTRTYFARLNADGSADSGFVPPALNSSVLSLAIQTDGAILIGGNFTAVEVDDGQKDDDDGDGNTTDDTGRHYIARFLANGSLDTAYDPIADGAVAAMQLLPDGRLLVGGSFLAFRPNSGTTYSRNYVALLAASGAVEDSFNPGANGAVTSFARQPDGKILIGGVFTVINLDDGEGDDDGGDGNKNNDADRHYLVRLNADFSLDTTFNPRMSGTVSALATDGLGRIYAGGAFSGVEPVSGTVIGRGRMVRFNADGSLDLSFNPTANDVVKAILCLGDNSVLFGGAFTDLLADSPIYVAGDFTTVGGVTLPRLARFNENGTPDGNFAPAPDAPVYALAADTSGRVLAAGAFTQVNGTARTRLARFNADGSLDSAFAPSLDGTVRTLSLAQSGNIIIGGEFGSVNGTARSRLARLSASGATDGAYAPTANATVHAIVALPDGRVLLAGQFTQVNGTARRYLARLNADGSLDGSFAPEPDAPVYALSARADGSVLVGGEFTTIAGQSRTRLAVLKSDGSLDSSFSTTANGTVWVAAGQLDGSTLIGGAFTSTAGTIGHLLNRVSGGTTGAYTFTVGSGLNTASWNLTGSAPIFASVTFSYSTNSNSWTTLGSGYASSDGKTWSWSGSALPANTPYLLRVRAVAPAVQGGSEGVVEEMWQFTNTQAAGSITLNQSGGGSGGSGGSGSGGSSSGLTSSLPAGTTVTPQYTYTTNAFANGYFGDFSTILRLKGSELHFVNFVIGGNTARRVFIRAAGPGLRTINITDNATAPRLELYTGTGVLWLKAVGPVTDTAVRTLATQLGALALDASVADAAAVTTLAPGAYTLAVWDGAGTGGAVMVELFEADNSAPSSLVAYSSRASAAANTGSQTSEFTIRGATNQKVLVRALGPALAGQGIAGAISDPQLLIQNSAGANVASNDNWETAVTNGSATPATSAELTAAAASVYAQALTAGSKDAVVLVNLAPGTYTATVTGTGSAAGISELEVFELPSSSSSGSTSSGSSGSSSGSSSSNSSGGGGAPSLGFTALLAALLAFRQWRQARKAD